MGRRARTAKKHSGSCRCSRPRERAVASPLIQRMLLRPQRESAEGEQDNPKAMAVAPPAPQTADPDHRCCGPDWCAYPA
jgi:hypothetical protein